MNSTGEVLVYSCHLNALVLKRFLFFVVTYAIQLAAAVSLLDMSPWQPDRMIAVLSKWLAELKELGSHQAPACVTDGLVCLKSIAKSKQT